MPDTFSTETDLHAAGSLQTEAVKEKAHMFFYGAGFVASFAAIGNIMQIETGFHEVLHEFGPAPKFWGTKILVSLAFLQSIFLGVCPPFNGWSAIRINLFYASLLTLECFLIALLHLRAWGHGEEWYEEQELVEKRKASNLAEPLLD